MPHLKRCMIVHLFIKFFDPGVEDKILQTVDTTVTLFLYFFVVFVRIQAELMTQKLQLGSFECHQL